MTEKLRVEHTFDVSEKGFWDTFLDEEYNRAMFRDSLKFPRWELTQFELTDEKATRVVEVEPFVGDLPRAVKAVLGNTIRYREEGTLDRPKNSYKLRIVPPKLQDKLIVSGHQFTEPLGEGRCKRVFTADIQIKIFAVGSVIEKLIVADMKKGYDVGAKFTQNYMREKGVQ